MVPSARLDHGLKHEENHVELRSAARVLWLDTGPSPRDDVLTWTPFRPEMQQRMNNR